MEAPLVLMPIHLYTPLTDFKDEIPIHLFIGGFIGGLHYLLTMQWYLIPAGILISAVVLILLYKSTLRLGWEYFK